MKHVFVCVTVYVLSPSFMYDCASFVDEKYTLSFAFKAQNNQKGFGLCRLVLWVNPRCSIKYESIRFETKTEMTDPKFAPNMVSIDLFFPY